jgi:transcriptional regulator with XRE-family HTH domain
MIDVEAALNDFDAALGARLASLREVANVSQAELAKALRASGFKFHQQMVGRTELGQRPMRVSELVELAGCLGVSIDALLDRNATDQPSSPTVDGLIGLVPGATLGELHRLRDVVSTALAIRSELTS